MDSAAIRSIAKTMKDFGIGHLKCGDLELTLQDAKVTQTRSAPSVPSIVAEEDADPIKHKTEALESLMKLSDTDLVDKLFPDHTQEEAS